MVLLKQLKRISVFLHLFLLILNFPSLIADKFCGKPPEIINGEAVVQGYISEFPVGTNITYSCYDGYILSVNGSDYAVCLNNSEIPIWQPPVATCESVCNHLPLLKHGRLQLDGRSLPFITGESIRYLCDSGYLPDQRNPKITCISEDGVANWTQTDGACRISVVSCNDPGYIENAHRIGSVFTYPHNVTYVCNEGFRLIGTATRFCSPKGQWLPHSSSFCEAIVCPFLSHPQNGKVISSPRRLHAKATYECNRYFNLSGSAERICQEDGTWTGDVPTCKEITCFDPGAIQHVRVIPQKTFHKAGDLVIFKCKYGVHQTSSKCLETGEWSKRPPLCPGPTTTEHVLFPIVTTTPTDEGDELNIIRKGPATTEHVLVPIVTTTPTDEGDELNIIRKASCDDPGKIKNGDKIFSGLSINSTVTYTCDEGYELRGKGTLLCMENGKWNLDKLPICVKPLSVPSIIGIVFGVLILVAIAIGGYFGYKWREKKLRGYGKKSKALTADATDLEEIAGLEKEKKPIPVTVL